MPEVAHWCQSCAWQEMRGWRRNKLLPGISLHLMPRAKRTKTCSRSQCCKAHCALNTRGLSTEHGHVPDPGQLTAARPWATGSAESPPDIHSHRGPCGPIATHFANPAHLFLSRGCPGCCWLQSWPGASECPAAGSLGWRSRPRRVEGGCPQCPLSPGGQSVLCRGQPHGWQDSWGREVRGRAPSRLCSETGGHLSRTLPGPIPAPGRPARPSRCRPCPDAPWRRPRGPWCFSRDKTPEHKMLETQHSWPIVRGKQRQSGLLWT